MLQPFLFLPFRRRYTLFPLYHTIPFHLIFVYHSSLSLVRTFVAFFCLPRSRLSLVECWFGVLCRRLSSLFSSTKFRFIFVILLLYSYIVGDSSTTNTLEQKLLVSCMEKFNSQFYNSFEVEVEEKRWNEIGKNCCKFVNRAFAVVSSSFWMSFRIHIGLKLVEYNSEQTRRQMDEFKE